MGVVGGSFAGRDPVDEAPPGQLFEQAVRAFVLAEPVQDGAGSIDRSSDRLRVGPVHPVVVQHADPEQRKGGDVLRQGTGIAAAGDALGNARIVEGREGLAGEPVVAGHAVGDQRLDAGVADVLELLVVGRVHVGFMGVEAGGAPADLPDLVEVGSAGLEFGALLKGIGGELGSERVQVKGIGAGGDVQVEVAPGSPPQRLEGAVVAAVGQEAVVEPEGHAVADLVAIAFVLVLVVEGFRVGEADHDCPCRRRR